MTKAGCGIAGLLALMAAMAAGAWAAEEELVGIDKLPAPAKTVIQGEAKASKIEVLMRVTDGPKTKYVAVLVGEGRETVLEVDPEGKVLRKESREREQEVTIEQVPGPVKAAILKEAGEAKVGPITRDPGEGKPTFYTEITTEENSIEIRIKLDAEGAVLWKTVREKLAIEQTPPLVKAAIENLSHGLKVDALVRETEKDDVKYRATLSGEGQELQLALDAHGKVLAKSGSELVPLDKAPDAVKATIQKEAAGGKVESIQRMTQGEQVEYVARLTVGRKMIELVLGPTGKILSKDVEEEEGEEKEPPAKK